MNFCNSGLRVQEYPNLYSTTLGTGCAIWKIILDILYQNGMILVAIFSLIL